MCWSHTHIYPKPKWFGRLYVYSVNFNSCSKVMPITGDPYSLQPVIDYIQHPNPEDSLMGRKMMTRNPSVIIPVLVALNNRIELYKEVNCCLIYCWLV